MRLPDRKEFISSGAQALGEIYDMLDMLPCLSADSLDPERTALVLVDMVNGFTREGALMSSRIEGIIPETAKLLGLFSRSGIPVAAFADCHTDASPEFGAYPAHCLAGTDEAEIVDELKEAGGYALIPKNSTNGFHEEAFREWLGENSSRDTFIVTGDCTDICIQQFSISLKTWFNRQNRKSRVIVPLDCVETYDLGMHSGDFSNAAALYNMHINGIELVKKVTAPTC